MKITIGESKKKKSPLQEESTFVTADEFDQDEDAEEETLEEDTVPGSTGAAAKQASSAAKRASEASKIAKMFADIPKDRHSHIFGQRAFIRWLERGAPLGNASFEAKFKLLRGAAQQGKLDLQRLKDLNAPKNIQQLSKQIKADALRKGVERWSSFPVFSESGMSTLINGLDQTKEYLGVATLTSSTTPLMPKKRKHLGRQTVQIEQNLCRQKRCALN